MATFEDRCGDFRRSMYRLSKIDDRCHDVLTFGDRCVDLRKSMCRPSEIDDRWSMCRPSKIDGREIRLLYLLKTLILYISCMRITPRVCTSVLSLIVYRYLLCTCDRNRHTVLLYIQAHLQHQPHPSLLCLPSTVLEQLHLVSVEYLCKLLQQQMVLEIIQLIV